jgi:hypothetical protein
MAALVAELVPRLEHTRSVVETVILEKVEFEVERAVTGFNGVGVVPLSTSQHLSTGSQRFHFLPPNPAWRRTRCQRLGKMDHRHRRKYVQAC